MNKFPKIIFSDFDGTLTKQGKFSPVFFKVLELIKSQGSQLVIVTGRPLSWAHFLLTHFELNCVITEGGGSVSEVDVERGNFSDISLVNNEDLLHLQDSTKELLNKFKGLQLSEDSISRKTDRAIDLNLLKSLKIDDELEEFLSSNNLKFSRSNVHLNFWSGEVSKSSGIEYFLQKSCISQKNCIYIGDSLNDESAFKLMDTSIGVSNISSVIDQLIHPPKIVLEGDDQQEIDGAYSYLQSIL